VSSLVSFVLRRLGLAVFVLLGLSMLIFFIARVLPGDPARTALGPHAPEYAVQNLRKQMYLDRPIYEQYALWLKGVLTKGDFGFSLLTRRPVQQDIKELFPATLELVLLAAVFMTLGGLALGVAAARWRGTWLDSVFRVVSYLGIATPSFVWLIMFVLLFGYLWPILPTVGRLSPGLVMPSKITGMATIDSLAAGQWATFWDAFKHLLLPAIALAMGGMAQAARITRSSMADHMDKDYIALETAYGLPKRMIFTKYLLKISMIPTVSILALDIAALFANAFICETIVSYPGLSRYGMQAILNKDLNAVVGTIMVLGTVFVLTTIVVDVIVAFLDPRMRLNRRAA
jgi:peptide/nickel transport system permease protein